MGISFILGSHRSGTTSLLRALELSRSTCCLMEPMPNLNFESRYLFDGMLYDPHKPILEHIAPRVAAVDTRISQFRETTQEINILGERRQFFLG